MRKSLTLVTVAITVSFLGSCVTFTKPGLDKVKKIAIIALESNKGAVRVNAKGEEIATLTGAASLLEGQQKGGNPYTAKILQKAAESFTKEIKSLGDYEVVYGATISSNGDFQNWAKSAYEDFGGAGALLDVGKALKGFDTQFLEGYPNTPKGRAYYGKKKGTPPMESLAKLCKELGVDAVALLDIKVTYIATADILGAGTADAQVQGGVYVYNQDQEPVMEGSWIKSGRQGPLGMIAGNVFLDKNTLPLFEKAVEKYYANMGKVAHKELSKKKK